MAARRIGAPHSRGTLARPPARIRPRAAGGRPGRRRGRAPGARAGPASASGPSGKDASRRHAITDTVAGRGTGGRRGRRCGWCAHAPRCAERSCNRARSTGCTGSQCTSALERCTLAPDEETRGRPPPAPPAGSSSVGIPLVRPRDGAMAIVRRAPNPRRPGRKEHHVVGPSRRPVGVQPPVDPLPRTPPSTPSPAPSPDPRSRPSRTRRRSRTSTAAALSIGLVVALLVSVAAFSTTASAAGGYILMPRSELLARPTSGTAWANLVDGGRRQPRQCRRVRHQLRSSSAHAGRRPGLRSHRGRGIRHEGPRRRDGRHGQPERRLRAGGPGARAAAHRRTCWPPTSPACPAPTTRRSAPG